MQQSTPSKKLHLIISNQSLIIHSHNHEPSQNTRDNSFEREKKTRRNIFNFLADHLHRRNRRNTAVRW